MVISIVVVISGVACSCIPLWLYPESEGPSVVDLFFPGFSELLGVSLVLISAAAAAGRAVWEEIIMLEENLLSPLTFAATSCSFSAGLVLFLLLVAQVLPGLDHGVQVTICASVYKIDSFGALVAALLQPLLSPPSRPQEDTVDSMGKAAANPILALVLLLAVAAAAGYQVGVRGCDESHHTRKSADF